MVFRPDFDNELVAQNRQFPNFCFLDEEPVLAIDYNGRFQVKTSKRELTATQLVGADGAYSIVNRTFHIAEPKGAAVAIEVNISKQEASLPEPVPPCFDFGAIEKGYGWIFPKDDHWSVGLYTLVRGVKDLRSRLLEYIDAKGFTMKTGTELEFEAHLIPVGGFRLKWPSVPVYLVGDAGGFADAITGEGIYHAAESGRIAGETIVKVASGRGSHRRYYRRLWLSVLPDTFLTYYISKKFYKNVGKAIAILESPWVWRPFVEGYAEGATFTKSILQGGLYLLRSFTRRTLKHETLRADQADTHNGRNIHSASP
jgi:flavin-dependent dehydrogenase